MVSVVKECSGACFGLFVDHYEKARREYPIEVFQTLLEKVGNNAETIDLGCGTGIATRQLKEVFSHVTGADVDEKMIQKASSHKDSNIQYVVSGSRELPFSENSFDLVTAFASFHWFCKKEDLDAIVHVLKPGGVFCSVNKHDLGTARLEFRNFIAQYIGQPISDPKADFQAAQILQDYGFVDVVEKKVEVLEVFTYEEALELVQSMSIWSLVAENQRRDCLEAVKAFLKEKYPNGTIQRPLEIVLGLGYKPK